MNNMNDTAFRYAVDIAWILWRSIWQNSSVDWSPYARRIWRMYIIRLRSAARRSSDDLVEFLSLFCHAFAIMHPGTNEDERIFLIDALHLPFDTQAEIVRQFELNLPAIILHVRQRRDAEKSARDDTPLHEKPTKTSPSPSAISNTLDLFSEEL